MILSHFFLLTVSNTSKQNLVAVKYLVVVAVHSRMYLVVSLQLILLNKVIAFDSNVAPQVGYNTVNNLKASLKSKLVFSGLFHKK